MVVEGVLRCLTITDFGSVVLEKKEKILQETDVFVFVFDITKAESFCYAQELRETVSNMVQSADSKLYFLLGNKADLPNHEISIESMQLSA